MAIRIFLTGATGFIGGSILDRLANHPECDTFDMTVLVRSSTKVDGFRSFGLNAVVGSLDDLRLVERLASESDIVFQAADPDHLPGTRAILSGMRKRFEQTNRPPSLIHTSGIAALSDGAGGEFASETIYSDLDVALFEALPVNAIHRAVDTTIVEASEQGYVRTYIVVIPMLWGIVSNDFVEKGLQNAISTGLSTLASMACSQGHVKQFGKGKNLIAHLEIGDAVDFYHVLFDAIIFGKNPARGREGYYCPENGELSQSYMCKILAQTLFDHGKIQTDQPVLWGNEEVEGNTLAQGVGSNCRSRGDRARSLGWNPVRDANDYLASIKLEVKYSPGGSFANTVRPESLQVFVHQSWQSSLSGL